MWQRWNGTSHVFEKSDDNGSSWAPLPLSAATITEGILSNSRLSGVALLGALNVFTLSGNHRFGSGTGAAFVTVNGGSGSGAGGATSFERNSAFQGAVGSAACIIGGITNDMIIYCAGAIGLQIFTNAVQAVTISSLGDMLVGPGGTPSAINYGARIAASVDRNTLTAVGAVNQSNTSGASAGFIFSTAGNSWIMAEGSVAKNGNALTWELDITAPVVRMMLTTNGNLIPGSDNSGAIGNNTYRWGLVRAVVVTPGDLTFDNGWTITEGEKVGLGPGLAFLDADENLVAFVAADGFKNVAQLMSSKTSKAERRDMKPVNHKSLLEAHVGK